MKGVFLGSDFMYRQDGKLVPIEINTEIAVDDTRRVETFEESFDVSSLVSFISQNGIKKLVLEGTVYSYVYKALKEWQGPELEGVEILHGKSLASYDNLSYEDSSLLAIRTTYSDDALVDYYCKDKIEFLNLIKDETFKQSYLYREGGELKGSIDIVDNGNHPNFIVKFRYPRYDREYPKLLRCTSRKELLDWAQENLEEDFYITPFLYNENNLLEFPNGHKRIAVYRHVAALVNVDDKLVSIPIGVYTKWCNSTVLENPSLDMYENGVLKDEFRQYYLTKNTSHLDPNNIQDLLAEKDDEILMSDGTWKKVQDLKEGDKVRSLKVEGKNGVDIHDHTVDYNESLEDFEAKTEFEEAEVVMFRGPVEGYIDNVRFAFEDGTTWNDTESSSYLIIDPEDGTVRFQTLDNIEVGNTILLLDATKTDKPVYIQKVIKSVTKEREFISGYGLTLDGSHIFLSREPGLPEMFASIEHNANSAIALKVICQSRPTSSIGNATVSAGHGACCCIVNNKIGITCQTTYLSEASCLDICNEWKDYWSSLWVIVPGSGTKC